MVDRAASDGDEKRGRALRDGAGQRQASHTFQQEKPGWRGSLLEEVHLSRMCMKDQREPWRDPRKSILGTQHQMCKGGPVALSSEKSTKR